MSEQNANVNINLRVNGNQQVNAAFSSLSSVMGALRGALGALGAALTAGAFVSGIVNGTKNAIDFADSMGKAAQKAGEGVREFSALAYSAKLGNVSTEQLQKVSKELSREFLVQGRSTATVRGELLALSDQMANMSDGAAKVALANEKLGKSGQDLIPWLSQGRAAIEAQMDEAERFGLVIGPEFARNADTFNTNLDRIRSMFQGVFNVVAEQVLPEMIRFTEWILENTQESGALRLAIDAIVASFRVLVTAISAASYQFEVMASFIGTFAQGIANGRTFLESYEMATEAASQTTQEFGQRLREIWDLSERTNAGAQKAQVRSAAITFEELDGLRKQIDLRIQFAKSQMEFVQAQIEAQRTPASSDQIAALRSQNETISQLLEDRTRLSERLPAGSEKQYNDRYLAQDMRDRTGNFRERAAITDPNSLREQMGQAMDEMRTKTGTIAQQIARTFTTVIGGAVRAISQGITGLINGTKTWGMALREIGSSVMNMVIEEIVRMGVQWVITHVLMEGVAKGFSYLMRALKGEEHAQTMSQESSKTSLLATNAALSTVSSYGGAILTIIALAAAVAGFAGAFAQGGRPPAGRVSLVGEQGPELFIPDQGGTIIPNHSMDRYLADLQKPGAAPTAQAKSKDLNLSILFDKREMRRQMQITDNEFMDAFQRNRHRLAI